MASQYRRGADFERKLKLYLEGLGYFVIRSAGSKGPVDLVAFGEDIYFIQCKLTGNISQAKLDELTELAEIHGARPALATPDNYKEIWR
jgi:Holliday junction resolvase